MVTDIYRKYLHFLVELLEDGKSEGSVNVQVDTSIYAHIIIACNTGMLVEWLEFDGSLDTTVFVKQMRELLLKGLIEGTVMPHTR